MDGNAAHGRHSGRFYDFTDLNRRIQQEEIRENFRTLADRLREEIEKHATSPMQAMDPRGISASNALRDTQAHYESLARSRDQLVETMHPGCAIVPLVHENAGCFRLLQFGTYGGNPVQRLRENFTMAVEDGINAAQRLVWNTVGIQIPRPPVRYPFHIPTCTPEGRMLELKDRSVALPAAAGFLSACSGRPIPQGVVLTGDIDPYSGAVTPMAGSYLRTKLRGLRSELSGWLHRLIARPADLEGLSEDEQRFITPVDSLSACFEQLWGPDWHRFPNPIDSIDLEESIKDAERYFGKAPHQTYVFRRQLETTLTWSTGDDRAKFLALCRLAWLDVQEGRLIAAETRFSNASSLGQRLLDARRISAEEYLKPMIQYASRLGEDFYRVNQGLEYVAHLLDVSNRYGCPIDLLGKIYGAKALLLRCAGSYPEAAENYNTAVRCFHDSVGELPRTYCWLAICCAELGQTRAADVAWQTGMELNDRSRSSHKEVTCMFLLYARARIDTRLRRFEKGIDEGAAVLRDLSKFRMPIASAVSSLIKRYLAECLVQSERYEDAQTVCADVAETSDLLLHNETYSLIAAQPHLISAWAAAMLNEREHAKTHLERAREMFLRHPFVPEELKRWIDYSRGPVDLSTITAEVRDCLSKQVY